MNDGSLFVTGQRKPEAEAQLICFPHAGGGPPAFFAWNALLGPRIECVCVQYPGRAQRWREPARPSVMDLVDEIVKSWEDVAPKRLAFYGHSFGGLVAFEVARRLDGASQPGPEWLFVGASRAPQLGLWLPAIHQLPDEEFVDVVQTRYGGIPEQIRADPEVLDLYLRPLRMDLKAYELYRMEGETLLKVPITAFAGGEDRSVPAHCMQGWRSRTEAGFEMKVLPCGHFFSQDALEVVMDLIRDRLLSCGSGRETTEIAGVGAHAEAE